MSKSPRIVRGWTEYDEAALERMAAAGASSREIAEQLGRTSVAVRSKAFNLGVKIPRVR